MGSLSNHRVRQVRLERAEVTIVNNLSAMQYHYAIRVGVEESLIEAEMCPFLSVIFNASISLVLS